MPLNSQGQYFSNPKQGSRAEQMSDTHDANGQKSQVGHVEENGEGSGPMEVHKMPEGYKTVAQNNDGSVDEQDHPDIHTAMHHMMAHFGEAKDPASDALDDQDEPDADDMDSGDVQQADSGAY